MSADVKKGLTLLEERLELLPGVADVPREIKVASPIGAQGDDRVITVRIQGNGPVHQID